MTQTKTLAVLAAAILPLAACAGSGQPDAIPENPIFDAAAACDVPGTFPADTSIDFDTEGATDPVTGNDSIDDIACVLVHLGMPESIGLKVDHTRALDGVQSDTWEDPDDGADYEVTWSYHPDSGLFLIVEAA
jgi:hypothetical protein